jgi:polyisoprenoid-binding protein YceI
VLVDTVVIEIRPMLNRRYLLAAPIATLLFSAALPLHAAEDLQIGAGRGSIDFTVGNSAFFRKWQGTVRIEESNIPASAVRVSIDTASIDTRDAQQDGQLRGPDFFDVTKFPTMTFVSTKVERTGPQKLKVTGDVTMRGITHPMVLDVEVQRHGAGAAAFTATGRVNRADFGMNKYLDITGNYVDIRIRAEATR